jgi:hypothetical protein
MFKEKNHTWYIFLKGEKHIYNQKIYASDKVNRANTGKLERLNGSVRDHTNISPL